MLHPGHSAPLAVLLTATLLVPCAAQERAEPPAKPPSPPVAIVDARVAGHEGPVTVLVAGGKVRAIAPRGQARAPRGVVVIEAGGGRLVPGRIDAFASVGSPHPLGRALDGFDPFDQRAIQGALASGVTAVALNPRRSTGSCGLATVIKLRPGATLGELVVVEESALCSSIGLGAGGPVARAEHAVALRKSLEEAAAYRDAWLDYEEALEEYVAELAKQPEGEGEAAKGGEGKPKQGKAKRGRRPPGKEGEEKASGEAEKKGEDEAKKGPKKPARPPVDRAKALWQRVLDRELPLRAEAHRVEDIANLLKLQDEFGFRLILEGATSAHRLAEALAAREVPVILGPLLPGVVGDASFPPDHRPGNAAVLRAAGVTVAIGSDSWEATPTLPFNAALAASAGAGAGLTPDQVDEALTSAPARILGVAERMGRVAVGFDADLVVLAPAGLGAERPSVVLVDGQVVYRREP